MTEDQFFYRLSPDKVLEAIEQADLYPSGQCQPLNSLENRVYSVVLDDGQTVVAKFYRPGRWSKEQVLEEHSFLFELAEADVSVCAPMRFPDGSSLKEIDNIFFALWPLTGGREPDEFTDEELAILGRLLARIHNTGAAKKSASRPVLNSDYLVGNALHILEKTDLVPAHLFSDYQKLALAIKAHYDSISEHVPLHRIHGDCHLGNLLRGHQGWFFLDFDDFTTGPAVQDLWMLVQDTGEKARYQMNVILDAYGQFREFSESWLNLIEPLRAMRFIHFSGWIAKRWQDPAFKQGFVNFGTEDYWVSEIDDLRKQIQKFEGGGSLLDEQPPEELSNKDFFWDWQD